MKSKLQFIFMGTFMSVSLMIIDGGALNSRISVYTSMSKSLGSGLRSTEQEVT